MSFLLILVLCSLSQGKDLDFAEHLMRQGDYYRAITEYKRVAYFADEEQVRDSCWLQIARCYRKSHKSESAIRYSTMVIQGTSRSESVKSAAKLNLALVYLENRMPQQAQFYLSNDTEHPHAAFRMACAGLASLQMRKLDLARQSFQAAAANASDSNFIATLLAVDQDVESLRHASRRSPLLASGLSFLVPGAGQAYSQHYYDAAQSFLFTASFALVSLALYNYEHDKHGGLRWTIVSVSITSLFHVANVIGANLTARYRNWKLDNEVYERAYNSILNHER